MTREELLKELSIERTEDQNYYICVFDDEVYQSEEVYGIMPISIYNEAITFEIKEFIDLFDIFITEKLITKIIKSNVVKKIEYRISEGITGALITISSNSFMDLMRKLKSVKEIYGIDFLISKIKEQIKHGCLTPRYKKLV